MRSSSREQARRFLSDRSRNRYNPAANALEVSEVFKWYRGDFEAGHGGVLTREQFFARYAAQLADAAEHQQRIREQKVEIRHVDYDWRLNDVPARRAHGVTPIERYRDRSLP